MGRKISVGVREAKARFTQLLVRVRNGAVVDITHRGREVAQIVPMPSRRLSRDTRLRALEERGWVTLPQRPVPRTVRPLRIRPSRDLQVLLREDRDRY
ncbi:MAG: type II toxin-antitoxin system prevent-host-death family antitoxin [Deltaproteobacteria bacterium]|nr:type II toxin-antitoxin system prevent-host-death family antitoxin [Deltaproteobacteria bacterium]